MQKPEWDSFFERIVGTINSYRYFFNLAKNSPNSNTYKDAFAEADKYWCMLDGYRTTISCLFPNNRKVAELNGFIVFAAASESNHETFIQNISNVVKELSKE